MSNVTVLADMAGRHTPHDVYNLWVHRRRQSILFGWQTAAGEKKSFCLDDNDNLHPVGVSWSALTARHQWLSAELPEHRVAVQHAPGLDGTPANFQVEVRFDGSISPTTFAEDNAALLFPATCFDGQQRPWVVMIKVCDVENDDGVIDQHNYIIARHRVVEGDVAGDDEWQRHEVADLAYGLLPKEGVWGYPGERRRPYIVTDDAGDIWILWERKEPHDGNTRICAGVLLGRRFADGQWSEPMRLIEEQYVDYAPDPAGISDGVLITAAQKAVPYTQPERGQVALLSADVTDCPRQPIDDHDQGWHTVNLSKRQYFTPDDRQLKLDGQKYRLLFGDPHTHTALSEDAEGDPEEMLSYARDKAKLDFVAITDNDYIYGGRLSDLGWRETMQLAQMLSYDDQFIIIPAYEWTQAKWGPCAPQHRSILFERYDEPILRWADAGIGQADDPFDALISWVESTSGIMNTQHPRFLLSDSDREANMEVVCGWGDYINNSDCFHDHLSRGFQVGFIGSSDGHRRTPGAGGGLTALWVTEFTLAGIIDAFENNRCYATAGARIGLKFWINDTFMGRSAKIGERCTARVAANAPRKVEKLEIIADGDVVATRADLSPEFDEVIEDLPQCSWYYAKLTMPGGFPEYPSNIAPAEGPWGWSSPVFAK